MHFKCHHVNTCYHRPNTNHWHGTESHWTPTERPILGFTAARYVEDGTGDNFNSETYANDLHSSQIFTIHIPLQAACPSYHKTNSIRALKA